MSVLGANPGNVLDGAVSPEASQLLCAIMSGDVQHAAAAGNDPALLVHRRSGVKDGGVWAYRRGPVEAFDYIPSSRLAGITLGGHDH